MTYDKIQPLITAVNLGEYCIVNVDKLDRFLGEQIVVLDLLRLDKGFLLHSYGVDSEALKSLLKNTAKSSFKVEQNIESLKENISSLSSVILVYKSIFCNLILIPITVMS